MCVIMARANICPSFALIECEDKSLSVVSCNKIEGGIWTTGEVSIIRTGQGVYNGVVKETGTYNSMEENLTH